MGDQIRFSVVIPLYNKEPHIGRALDSVFAQTFTDFEVLVVDDGSTDGGPEIVKSYTDGRRRLISQPNGGVSVARNRGIRAASNEYIAFLDADDAWEPCFLETISGLITKFPEAGAYSTAFRIVQPDGSFSYQNYRGIPPAPWEGIVPNYFKASAQGSAVVHTSSVCIPKWVFASVGFFVADEKYGEDTAMWGRIALKYPIAFSHYMGATHYGNAVNRACGSHRQSREWSFVAVAEHAMMTIDDVELRRHLREYLDKSLMRMAIDNICIDNGEFARKLLPMIRGREYIRKKNIWKILSYLPFPVTKLIIRLAS